MVGRIVLVPTLCLLLAPPASGQQAAGPESSSLSRTEFGHPDIQGVWATEFVTLLERPPGVERLVVDSEEGARALAQGIRSAFPRNVDPDFETHGVDRLLRVRGEYRSSVIVDPADGRLPLSKAGAELASRLQTRFLEDFDDPEQRPLAERCLSNFGFAPIRALPLFLPKTIFQTRDHVLIHSEDAVGLRTIHLHGEPPPEEIRTVEGDSRGLWEDDTLVVETTHLRALFPGRAAGPAWVVLGPDTRIEERFTPISDDEIVYRYTVIDDQLYTQPWTGELTLTRHDGPQYEYACHEGNYSLKFSLSGGQAEQDREAAEPGGEDG